MKEKVLYQLLICSTNLDYTLCIYLPVCQMATLNILWHFFIVAVLRNGKTNKFVLPLSTLTLRSTCDILFRQAWKNLIFLQGRRDHAESVTTTSDYDERKTVRALQEWIDSCLNMSLKAELLREIFYHEFDFSRNVSSNLQTQNAIDSSVDIYFRISNVDSYVL